MLCSSIRRWKFQRSRIGKLPNSAWYLNRRLQRREARCWPASTPASSSSVWPCCAPQLGRPHMAEPVDDVRHHAEQQRLEGADGGREQRHQREIAPQAARARPQEGEEAPRRRWRQGLRVRMHQAFEGLEQAGSLGASWAHDRAGAGAWPAPAGGRQGPRGGDYRRCPAACASAGRTSRCVGAASRGGPWRRLPCSEERVRSCSTTSSSAAARRAACWPRG